VKRPPLRHRGDAGTTQPIGEGRVRERNDRAVHGLYIAMQVPDQVSDACRFFERSRPHDQHFLERRRYDVGARPDSMEHLSGQQYGARRQFERQPRTIRRIHEPAHATPVVRRHRQLDDVARGGRVSLRQLTNGDGLGHRAPVVRTGSIAAPAAAVRRRAARYARRRS
jgi:hypothetical protein